MAHTNVVLPGSTIGILGDGQLARMIGLDGARLGYKFRVLGTGGRESPAGHVVYWAGKTNKDYSVDVEVFEEFCRSDVVLCEFENVPTDLVRRIESRGIPVCARNGILEIAQNRVFEKHFAQSSGIAVTPFREVRAADGSVAKVRSILKTCSNGYDGKSQVSLEKGESVDEAWRSLGSVRCVLEERIAFKTEISVIVARSGRGEMSVYGPFENEHRDGILRTTTYPASVSPDIAQEAIQSTLKLALDLNLQGILCVEYFVTHTGRVLFNEMAARPHNSGHITQRLCDVSQFEAYVRAACNLPVLPARFHTNGTMTNIIGPDMDEWLSLVGTPECSVHHYGKDSAPKGRKVGHVIMPERVS